MKTTILRAVLIGMVACTSVVAAPSGADVLKASGVQGGIVVHVGCKDGTLTAALRANERYLVHGLTTSTADAKAARKHIRSLGQYGAVSVDTFDGKRLPYIDNLVNLVVADDLGDVPMAEVMRVLAPLGVAMIGGARTVKPWPDTIDEWPQYLHGADNNAVAQDTVVGPPRHLQWVGDPAWSRSHMAIATVVSMVSAKGRLFTIEDTTTPENPFLPGRFSLIARGAFNGVVLWKHDFPDWEPITRYIKDMAVQLQRRLAAIDDVVYCTPGISAPLTAFDAATGKVLRTYKGTQKTQEFAAFGGVLYAVIGDRMNSVRYNIVKTYSGKGVSMGGSDPKEPFDGTGFRGGYSPESPNRDNPICDIVAIDAETGRELWRQKGLSKYTACSLAIRGKLAVYQTGGGLFCVDRTTGAKVWTVSKSIQSGDGTEANTVILTAGAVYAKEGSSLQAYSLADGSEMWKAPIANNYEKSADLFFAGGAIWTGGSKQPSSYHPQTGAKLSTIPQKMTKPMGHDRCYRNFITDRYYINSKTGGADFLKLDSGQEFPHHWIRGTCGMGVIPCNGLLYAPPFSCQCSIGAMIKDFNAVYAEKGLKSPGQEIQVQRNVRLVKGPAYGEFLDPQSSNLDPTAWPTYRGGTSRGGATKLDVPAKLRPLWTAKLTSTPSAPVIAGGKVFVADTDAHTVHAMDATTGKNVWNYVAGARVDSPPTYHKGLVLFGSRDGWVHCLRASDGELVWRFKDLPDKTIGGFGQLESAWPVNGSVLVSNDVVYFAAGRSSFLDGGIFLYAIQPKTGKVLHSRQIYGPFAQGTGFPDTTTRSFKADILSADDKLLYIRHRAFNADLTGATPAPHVIASAGFLDPEPQHRTYWTVASRLAWTGVKGIDCDMLATDGKRYFGVQGFRTHRHSYFDPRLKGYKLMAGTLGGPGASKADAVKARRGTKGKKGKAPKPAKPAPTTAPGLWSTDIPLTGKAIALAGEVLFIAGTPAHFPPNHPVEKYVAAYEGKLGGVLWAASAKDGKKLALYKLDAPPAGTAWPPREASSSSPCRTARSSASANKENGDGPVV